MMKRECDRCGKLIPEVLPMMNYRMEVIKCYKQSHDLTQGIPYRCDNPIDLCEECQHAVYDFIFKREEEGPPHPSPCG